MMADLRKPDDTPEPSGVAEEQAAAEIMFPDIHWKSVTGFDPEFYTQEALDSFAKTLGEIMRLVVSFMAMDEKELQEAIRGQGGLTKEFGEMCESMTYHKDHLNGLANILSTMTARILCVLCREHGLNPFKDDPDVAKGGAS